MTDDIKEKALALLNEVADERGNIAYFKIYRSEDDTEALCRAIEQHEAFKQEVSDALVWYFGSKEGCVSDALRDFIIPAPKPDPLIEVLRSVGGDDRDYCDYDIYVKEIRAALEARGFEIRSKNDD